MFLNNQDFIKEDPKAILEFLEDNFTFEIPDDIESDISMRRAGNMMAKLTNSYSFLMSVSAGLSIYVKELKNLVPPKPRSGEDGTEYEIAKRLVEDMQLRKSIIDTYADIMLTQYKCISRMLTLKMKIDEEKYMVEGK